MGQIVYDGMGYFDTVTGMQVADYAGDPLGSTATPGTPDFIDTLSSAATNVTAAVGTSANAASQMALAAGQVSQAVGSVTTLALWAGLGLGAYFLFKEVQTPESRSELLRSGTTLGTEGVRAIPRSVGEVAKAGAKVIRG